MSARPLSPAGAEILRLSPIEPHPIADLFPVLGDDELQELADDIATNGLQQPIVLLDRMILDGRNRYRACELAGIEPEFIAYRGDDPVAFVVSANLHRRHLTVGQRALVAETLATMRQGERTDLMPKGTRSRRQASELLNVSERSTARARALRSSSDADDLVAAVERGEMTLGAATAEAQRRKLPTPREAKRQATATGCAVIASDGYIYTARPEAEEKAEGDRVRRVARILDALKALAVDTATEVVPLIPWYRASDVDDALPRAKKFISELQEDWSDREATPGPRGEQ